MAEVSTVRGAWPANAFQSSAVAVFSLDSTSGQPIVDGLCCSLFSRDVRWIKAFLCRLGGHCAHPLTSVLEQHESFMGYWWDGALYLKWFPHPPSSQLSLSWLWCLLPGYRFLPLFFVGVGSPHAHTLFVWRYHGNRMCAHCVLHNDFIQTPTYRILLLSQVV